MKFNKKEHKLNNEESKLSDSTYYLMDLPAKVHNLYGKTKYQGIDEYITAIQNAETLALKPNSFVIFRRIRGSDGDW